MAEDDPALSEPLLTSSREGAEGLPVSKLNGVVEDADAEFGVAAALANLRKMMSMFVPLFLNLTCAYSINIVTLAFVGHLGKQELAAAALATSLVGIVGRTVLYGMTGALDTLASQAYGAGNLDALGAHFRTALVFLVLHAVPLFSLLAALPLLLQEQGAGGPGGEGGDLGAMAGRYVRHVLPWLALELVNRPLNSCLVAQRITRPQMTIQMVALPLHVANNYVLIHVLGLGYLGAAWATCLTAAYGLVMMLGYVAATGQAARLWRGPPLHRSMWKALSSFAKLSYPSCIMRCAESWGFSLMTLAAGKLPDPGTAVAAASISFNLYGILYMVFLAFSTTTSTAVGNALGSGSGRAARHAALTSLCAAPAMWVIVATLLIEPHSQHALALIFTDGSDPALMGHLRRMLVLVAALELFDGSQVVMTGVIQGAGKQRLGVVVNVVAFYVAAIPTALLLAFRLGWGVEGMYTGMLLGPAIQAVSYVYIISRLDWGAEARAVAARAAASSRAAVGAAEQTPRLGAAAAAAPAAAAGGPGGGLAAAQGHREGASTA